MQSQNISAWQTYRRLMGYVAIHWVIFGASVIGFMLFAVTQPAFARLMEYIVDSLSKQDNSAQWIIPTAMLGIFLVRGIGFAVGNYSISWVARQVIHQLRMDIFDQLLVVPASYYHKHASGTLLSKLIFNVEQVTGAATEALKIFIREGLTIIGLLVYLFYLSWHLSLIFLLVGPFITSVVSYAAQRLRHISSNLQESMGHVTSTANEVITGHEVVRLFGGQEHERKRFRQASNNNRQQSMKLALAESITTPLVQMLVAVALSVLIFMALQLNVTGIMSTGQFIAFITAAALLTKPLRSVTQINSILQQGIAASQSIFALLDADTEPDQGQQRLQRAQGHLELRNVQFAYQKEPVIKNLNLDLPVGKTIALVGRSGSGKSTLVNLLLRFYEPQQGCILLDGIDLKDWQRRDLRNQFSLVNQQIVLFNGTIAENIAYGALANAPSTAIKAAADAARVSQFANDLPAGLDTQIGEAGVRLSGGQRQRIALARALLKDSPVLVLDEATSALDTESERYIQTALAEVMTKRTTLVIAHRLSTIKQADMILVMEQGQVVEQGNHQQLLIQNGLYTHLYQLQFKAQEDIQLLDSQARSLIDQ